MELSFKDWFNLGFVDPQHTNADQKFAEKGVRSKIVAPDGTPSEHEFDPDKLFGCRKKKRSSLVNKVINPVIGAKDGTN